MANSAPASTNVQVTTITSMTEDVMPEIKILPKYADVPDIKRINKTDWVDSMMKNRVGVALQTLGEDKCVDMSQKFLSDMVNGVSMRTVAYALCLSWNLTPKGDAYTRIYPPYDETRTAADEKVDEITEEGKFVTVEQPTTLTYPAHKLGNVRAGTYIAASLLRTSVKDPGSYMSAVSRIKSQYRAFYQSTFPMPNYEPKPYCVNKFSMLIKHSKLLRNGMTGLLYHQRDLSAENGELTRFLFEMHVECAGLHAWRLFDSNIRQSKMDVLKYLSWLEIGRTRDALHTIKIIYTDFEDTPDALLRGRKTWRYARLYDHQYFSELQTKHCRELVYIQARLSKLFGTPGTGDVTNILI